MLHRPPPSRTERQRRKAEAEAARKRRYRRLLNDGGACLRVPVKDINAVVAALLDLRWLPLEHSEDRKQVGEALGRMVDDLAAHKRQE